MADAKDAAAGRRAGALLTVAIAVLAALLLFELLLRSIGFNEPIWYQPDRDVGWILRPGIAGWTNKEGRAYVAVNSAGWRDDDHAVAKPADTFRIAVLGDSYVEAMQVARDDTFWAKLPQELTRCGFGHGKRIEILSFAASGWGTAQEYLALKSRAMNYAPDLVLLMFTNGNDVRNNSRALEGDETRPYYVADGDGHLQLDESFASMPQFASRSSWKGHAYRKVVEMSRLAQLVNTVRNLQFVPKASAAGGNGIEQGLEPQVLAPPQESEWEDAWRVTERLIAETGHYAQSRGIGFLVVTIPYAIQVDPNEEVRVALQEKLGVPDLLYPDKRVAAVAAREGLPALPLAPEMQRLAEKNKVYYHGFPNIGMGRGHWNADGHRVAAQLIALRLCQTAR